MKKYAPTFRGVLYMILLSFPLMAYLNLLLDTVSRNATVVMNCFTWTSFCQNGFFDINKTHSEVGLASEIFRRMKNVIRSPHPIYSLCARGPLARDLMKHEGPTCWGKDTPFEQLVNRNSFCLSIGTDLSRGNTLFHHFEEMKKVPYRHFKEFSGTVNFGDGEKEYKTKFFVRNNQNMEYEWRPAIDLLTKRGMIKGLNLDFKVNAVFASDLQKICYSLLDKNLEVFIVRE